MHRYRWPSALRLLILLGAVAVAGASIGVLVALPGDAARPVLLTSLTIALLALATAGRAVWTLLQAPPSRDQAPGRPRTIVVRPTLSGDDAMLNAAALGGPCDGQEFQVPAPPGTPREIWLADERREPARCHHRYALDALGQGGAAYRYVQPQDPPAPASPEPPP